MFSCRALESTGTGTLEGCLNSNFHILVQKDTSQREAAIPPTSSFAFLQNQRHAETQETHRADLINHHQGAPLRWSKAPCSGQPAPRRTLSALICLAPGRPGTALPATRWARLREHRIALNLDSSVPRRFSPAAYSSCTDGKMSMQCRPRRRDQARATWDSPAGPEGKEMGAAPGPRSLHCVELDAVHTPSC